VFPSLYNLNGILTPAEAIDWKNGGLITATGVVQEIDPRSAFMADSVYFEVKPEHAELNN